MRTNVGAHPARTKLKRRVRRANASERETHDNDDNHNGKLKEKAWKNFIEITHSTVCTGKKEIFLFGLSRVYDCRIDENTEEEEEEKKPTVFVQLQR